MSGHSKWSKVKHQKESTDTAKGKIFTKIASAIIIAVRESGGIIDPASNFRLRLAIEKARAANMPRENIERAIERGSGKSGEGTPERAVYEAYGPGKAGFIIEATTDNHQRTTAQIKNILDRGGGVLADLGSVSYLFKYVGELRVKKDGLNIDKVMDLAIEAGGDDVGESGEYFIIYTNPTQLHKVKEYIEKKGVIILSSELIYKPTVYTKVDENQKKQVISLVEVLSLSDDVQKVYTTLTI